MTSTSIRLPVQFTAHRRVGEEPADVLRRVRNQIRNISAVTDLSLQLGSYTKAENNSRNSNQYEYESSRTIRLCGFVTLVQRDREKAQDVAIDFVTKFTSHEIKNLYLSVEPGKREEDVLFYHLNLEKPFQMNDIANFRLGSRVGLSHFVSHFNTNAVDRRMFPIHQLKGYFEHHSHRFNIKFFVPHPNAARYDRRQENYGTNYEIRVKYNAVAEVILMPISETGNLIRVYFILKSPPLLYEAVHSLDDVRRNVLVPFTRAVTLPLTNDRWGISKEDWGRSNVLSIDLIRQMGQQRSTPNRKGIHNNFQYKEFKTRDPWSVISNLKRFTDHVSPIPFYFAHMDFSDRTAPPRRPKNCNVTTQDMDHFNYAVSCCTSISHQFEDSLLIENRWWDLWEYLVSQSTLR